MGCVDDMEDSELPDESVQKEQEGLNSPSDQRETSSVSNTNSAARDEKAAASTDKSGSILRLIAHGIGGFFGAGIVLILLSAAIWAGYRAVQYYFGGSISAAAVMGGISLLFLSLEVLVLYRISRGSGSSGAPYGEPPSHYRSEWETPRVEASRTAGVESWWRMGIGAAIFWPLTAIVFIYMIWPSLAAGQLGAAATGGVILILPLVGAFYFANDIYKGVRHRLRYDRAVFAMDEMPAVLGGTLSGTVDTGMSTAEGSPLEYTVELKCLKRHPKQRGWAASYDCLWSTDTRAEGRLDPDGRGDLVPVDFHIPEDQPPSTPEKRRDRILWRVDLSAETANPPYAQSIEVPIFPRDPVSNPSTDSTAETGEQASPS